MLLKQVPVPPQVYMMLQEQGATDIRGFVSLDGVQVLLALEPTPHGTLRHLSISRRERYPTWDEIHSVRNELLPADKDFMMVLPREGFYVNLHNNCFHLWETPKEWGFYEIPSPRL